MTERQQLAAAVRGWTVPALLAYVVDVTQLDNPVGVEVAAALRGDPAPLSPAAAQYLGTVVHGVALMAAGVEVAT